MGKIILELFGRDCEIVSYEYKKENYLTFEFTEELDGHLVLGRSTEKLKGKSCTVNIKELADGEHIPRLILKDMTIDLPKLINEYGIIYPAEHSLNEIGEISLRERRLSRRVTELEARLEEISKKVFGSTIF